MSYMDSIVYRQPHLQIHNSIWVPYVQCSLFVRMSHRTECTIGYEVYWPWATVSTSYPIGSISSQVFIHNISFLVWVEIIRICVCARVARKLEKTDLLSCKFVETCAKVVDVVVWFQGSGFLGWLPIFFGVSPAALGSRLKCEFCNRLSNSGTNNRRYDGCTQCSDRSCLSFEKTSRASDGNSSPLSNRLRRGCRNSTSTPPPGCMCCLPMLLNTALEGSFESRSDVMSFPSARALSH
mmetsp:Transcript_25345/g.61041  ORF Transcript_25345/g.61041 Transcript_25345/m.61041 type:complete len:238 (+) Transcript_25345:23-736(+)